MKHDGEGEAMDEYMTTEEVAAWLKVAPSTVCRWRMAGKGPRVTWLSPSLPRYRRDHVATWLEAVAA
ncbi:hypothetical protein GCM10010413_41220 [Promicromonospora sukumoe]